MLIVSKFGGTSMASAESIRRIARILYASTHRSVAIVSAPGKIGARRKVTDLLLSGDTNEAIQRYRAIIASLNLPKKAVHHVYEKLAMLEEHTHADALLSYGEYMSAYILATHIGWRFIDACDVVFFHNTTVHVHRAWSSHEKVVIPGFYGYDLTAKRIRVFPRGGSDVSAAHIAAGIGADLYENWTDVCGVYDVDPQKHTDAKRYEYLRYHELEHVARGGAQVFHPDAIFPAQNAGVPIVIKSTFAPHEAGTFVF